MIEKLHLYIFIFSCTVKQFQILWLSRKKPHPNTKKKGRQKYNLISKLHHDSSMDFGELRSAKTFFSSTKFCLGTSLGEYLVFQIPSFNQIKPFEDLNDLESYCWSHAQWSRHTILYNAQITLAYRNAEIDITSWCESETYSEEVLHLVTGSELLADLSPGFFL